MKIRVYKYIMHSIYLLLTVYDWDGSNGVYIAMFKNGVYIAMF